MLDKDYKKLSQRSYKKYKVCQFPGCNKPLEKDQKKYCSPEHARLAQAMYIAEWKKRHPENVKLWNHRYWLRKKKKKANQITI